jgi:hypothetical protein
MEFGEYGLQRLKRDIVEGLLDLKKVGFHLCNGKIGWDLEFGKLFFDEVQFFVDILTLHVSSLGFGDFIDRILTLGGNEIALIFGLLDASSSYIKRYFSGRLRDREFFLLPLDLLTERLFSVLILAQISWLWKMWMGLDLSSTV